MDKNGVIDAVVRDLQTLYGTGAIGALSDGQLLDRFVERREGTVFEAIIRRHGPVVWGVCRRVLRDHHDAEDAFQATFLVLARKSASIMPRANLGNWLHGVAYRTAMKARAQRTKRRGREAQVSDMPEPMAAPDDPRDELAESLDRELTRLPEKYRIPIVLCDFEGRTHREAASQLGWPVGTVSSRLSRARSMLAKRLSRRGVSLSAGSLTILLAQEAASAGMPTRLIGPTAQAASLFAAGEAATAGAVSAKVAALTKEVLLVMLLGKLKIATVTLLVASALVAGRTGVAYRAEASESASQKKAPGTKGQDQRNDDPTIAKYQESRTLTEQRRKFAELTRPAQDDPDEVPIRSLAPDADVHLRPGQEPHPEDALAELIVAVDHTPEQLERAQMIIESMIILEKEAHGKSREEIDKMIQDKTSVLEKARWEVRVMDAQLRRLKAIKQTTHGSVPDKP